MWWSLLTVLFSLSAVVVVAAISSTLLSFKARNRADDVVPVTAKLTSLLLLLRDRASLVVVIVAGASITGGAAMGEGSDLSPALTSRDKSWSSDGVVVRAYLLLLLPLGVTAGVSDSKAVSVGAPSNTVGDLSIIIIIIIIIIE
jgi:hypothetical protein